MAILHLHVNYVLIHIEFYKSQNKSQMNQFTSNYQHQYVLMNILHDIAKIVKKHAVTR
jgi:hypothetical protein